MSAPESEVRNRLPYLREGELPTLVFGDHKQRDVTSADALSQVAIVVRYDAHFSREFFRAVGMLLALKAAGDSGLTGQVEKTFGQNKDIYEHALNEYHLNIMEFVTHPHLLNEQALSETQTTILKSTYGLPLTDSELEIYRQCTGRETYDVMEEQTEVSLIAGHRAGKTGKVGSPIVCYEAFRDHGVPTGEDAYVMLLAPTLKQSKIAFKYIRNYLQNSEILRHRIKVTSDEIILDNHVVIGCYACTHDNVRGRTVNPVVCDEIRFRPDGEETAGPAEEVLAALRPGMATLRKTELIKNSTPFAKFGLCRITSSSAQNRCPVWQVRRLK